MNVTGLRFAANLFIGVLDKFPRLEVSAYLLVLCIGAKLIIEGAQVPGVDFHDSSSAWFWGFWGVMALCLVPGLRKTPPFAADEGEKRRD